MKLFTSGKNIKYASFLKQKSYSKITEQIANHSSDIKFASVDQY